MSHRVEAIDSPDEPGRDRGTAERAADRRADQADRAPSRGATWLSALTDGAAPMTATPASVRVVDGTLGGEPCRYIAVVPDPANPYPRARDGEVGLIEGWELGRCVREAIAADRDSDRPRSIVAVVDVTSQAYGRREEALGIHAALAGAAGAYAEARLAGHPVIGLVVGKAMSGAFLAHGYQANRLIALNDPGVLVHAMGKGAAARVTLRSTEDLERLASEVPPMAYDIASYHSLGLLWKLLDVGNADRPDPADVTVVRAALEAARRDIVDDPTRDLRSRLGGGTNRSASVRVRERLAALWEVEGHR
jgi:malonate decarboxylase gamma subunit